MAGYFKKIITSPSELGFLDINFFSQYDPRFGFRLDF